MNIFKTISVIAVIVLSGCASQNNTPAPVAEVNQPVKMEQAEMLVMTKEFLGEINKRDTKSVDLVRKSCQAKKGLGLTVKTLMEKAEAYKGPGFEPCFEAVLGYSFKFNSLEAAEKFRKNADSIFATIKPAKQAEEEPTLIEKAGSAASATGKKMTNGVKSLGNYLGKGLSWFGDKLTTEETETTN